MLLKVNMIKNLFFFYLRQRQAAGLKLKYGNIKFESIRTKSKLLPNSKPVTISLPTDKIDIVKTKRAIMPNFIDSLDTVNVHILLNKLAEEDKKNFCLYNTRLFCHNS